MSALGGNKSAPRNVKRGYELDQRRRVKDAIEKQRSARKERMDLARRLGQDAEDPSEQNDVSIVSYPATLFSIEFISRIP